MAVLLYKHATILFIADTTWVLSMDYSYIP